MKVTTISALAIAITVVHAAIADVPSRTRQLYSRSMIEKRMKKTPEELQREEISRMVTEFTKLLVTQEANKQKAQQQQPQYYYVNNAPPPNYFPANPTATVHDNCGGVSPCPPPTLPPVPTSNCVSGSPCPSEPIPPAIQALLPPGAVPTTPGIPGYYPGYYPLNTGLPTTTTKATTKGEDEEDSEEKDQDDDEEKKEQEEKKDEDKDDEDEPEDDEGKLEKRQTINDASINAISSSSPPPAPDESESESQENGEDEA